MITRELVKAEIDKVQDEYLEILYRVAKSLTRPADTEIYPPPTEDTERPAGGIAWDHFIEQTYGSLADDPIERGEQGQYEVREAIE